MQNPGIFKMGKSKADFKSPRRRRSGNLLNRPISRNRPATATISAAAAAAAVGANIKVVIRVRPPNVNEQGDNQRSVGRFCGLFFEVTTLKLVFVTITNKFVLMYEKLTLFQFVCF